MQINENNAILCNIMRSSLSRETVTKMIEYVIQLRYIKDMQRRDKSNICSK